MKGRKLTVLSLITMILLFTNLKVQTHLFMDENNNPANTDLYSIKNIGVGSNVSPIARNFNVSLVYRLSKAYLKFTKTLIEEDVYFDFWQHTVLTKIGFVYVLK